MENRQTTQTILATMNSRSVEDLVLSSLVPVSAIPHRSVLCKETYYVGVEITKAEFVMSIVFGIECDIGVFSTGVSRVFSCGLESLSRWVILLSGARLPIILQEWALHYATQLESTSCRTAWRVQKLALAASAVIPQPMFRSLEGGFTLAVIPTKH